MNALVNDALRRTLRGVFTALSTGSVDNLPSLLLERFYYPILPVEAGMETTEVQMETPGLHGEPGAV